MQWIDAAWIALHCNICNISAAVYTWRKLLYVPGMQVFILCFWAKRVVLINRIAYVWLAFDPSGTSYYSRPGISQHSASLRGNHFDLMETNKMKESIILECGH
jgi:hypothetical protein